MLAEYFVSGAVQEKQIMLLVIMTGAAALPREPAEWFATGGSVVGR